MKVLVTGASGFLGRRVVENLRGRGAIVRAFVRPTAASRITADEVVIGDLADRGAIERAVHGVTAVVHAGARVSTQGPWEDFERINVRATEAVLHAAIAAGASRVLHVSSLSVFAVPADGATIDEDGAYDADAAARGLYARSKLAADRIARTVIAEGGPVTIVRPGLLYGPGRPIPLARKTIALGRMRLILARPDYLLPLAYVDNVADAICLALARDAACGRTYTVVDTHVPQARFLDLYRAISGARWIPVYLPVGTLLRLTGACERLGLPLPLRRHQLERTVWRATFSVQRAERELGWSPRVPVEEALRRTLFPPGPQPESTPTPVARAAV